MGAVIFIVVLFIVFVGGGWLLGRSVGGFLGNMFDRREDKPTYIDNSVHHHYHNHTHDYAPKTISTHNHTHQHLTVIDEETHQRGLDHFSNKKESRYE